MKQRITFRLSTVFIVLALLSIPLAYYAADYRNKERAFRYQSVRTNQYQDGRQIDIEWSRNGHDQTTAVVVTHYSTTVPEEVPILLGRRSSRHPIKGLLSNYKLAAGIPSLNNNSGLWINGKRREVGNNLTCIYISDKTKAIEIDISPRDTAAFLNDMRELEALLFIEKWILPQSAG